MWSFVWRQKKSVLGLSSLMLFVTAARLGEPYLYKIIVDTLTDGIVANLFTSAHVTVLSTSVIVWAVLAFVTNIGSAQMNFLVWKIGNQNSQWAHLEGYKRLLRLDYQAHTRTHSSRLAKIVDEADTSLWEMTNWWLGRFTPAALGFCAMLVIALSVSIPMTLVALAIIPPGLGVVVYMISKCETEQRRVNKLWQEKHEHMSDQVTNIVTYKMNEDEHRFMSVQKQYSDRASDAQQAINVKWRLAEMLNPDILARFAVMGIGIYLVKESAITLGTLFMFMGLLSEILTPLHLLGDILPQYSRRARHIERQIRLISKPDTVLDPRRPKKLPHVKGALEFSDVSFVYDSNEKNSFSIKHVSFKIEPGQHIAIVGHSGSGKTTIMGLITRLMDPSSGKVLIDAVSIKDFKQADLKSFLGVVLQENSLYNETAAENVSYGNPKATRRQVIAACKKAAAHKFISKLPKGYDTLIGERGVRLSGGEKQRLAIARAILKNPRIVVLDEPTSALDSITEAQVQKGLDKLIEKRTAVVIAHRLSTVRNADKIIVIEEGRIIGQGTHLELLRTCQTYNDMVQLQTGGFLADE